MGIGVRGSVRSPRRKASRSKQQAHKDAAGRHPSAGDDGVTARIHVRSPKDGQRDRSFNLVHGRAADGQTTIRERTIVRSAPGAVRKAYFCEQMNNA
jgi:hypothetical protein